MASSVADVRTISLSAAVPRITRCFTKGRSVFLHGASGIGKSDLVKQIAANLPGPVDHEGKSKPSISVDVRMGLMQPTDLMGIPYFNKDKGVMDWAPPIVLPNEAFASQYHKVILFLDEFNTATPATMASAYQLVLDRQVGAYKLPKNVVIIAAGNRTNDRGVTHKMPGPLANRFVHLEIAAEFDAWFDWAVRNNVHPDVVGYLQHSKGQLHLFDPSSSSHAFPSPRSWTFLSELIGEGDISDAELADLASGTVGEGPALTFMAHRKVANTLPKPMDILEGKVTELNCKEMSAVYSLGVAMCYELQALAPKDKTDKKGAERQQELTANMFKFTMKNMAVEMNVMIARLAISNYNLPFNPKSGVVFNDFFERYQKYLMPTK